MKLLFSMKLSFINVCESLSYRQWLAGWLAISAAIMAIAMANENGNVNG
jgi:hypothetical protein